MPSLYDQDFYCWALETAAALRSGRIAEVDLDHVAEEIEGMANRDLRELSSRLRRILEHKLKLELLSGRVRAPNQRGWRASISVQQSELETLLAQSPSLRPRIPDLLPAAYRNAVRTVTRGYDVTAPLACPWSQEEILD